MTQANYPQPTYETAAAQPIAPELVDRAYEITISQLDHGYTVRVGCKIFAFESKEKMIEKITAYLNDVSGVTKSFWDKTLIF